MSRLSAEKRGKQVLDVSSVFMGISIYQLIVSLSDSVRNVNQLVGRVKSISKPGTTYIIDRGTPYSRVSLVYGKLDERYIAACCRGWG